MGENLTAKTLPCNESLRVELNVARQQHSNLGAGLLHAANRKPSASIDSTFLLCPA